MSSILDLLGSQLDASTLARLGSQVGATPEQTSAAVSAALPALLGALHRNSSTPQGEAALGSALDRDHDGSILDNLGGLLGGGAQGGIGGAIGGAILGHVLGGKQSGVQEKIGRATGLDAGAVGQLLAILAPIVLGALGRASQRGGGGLGSVLGGAREEVQAQAPQSSDLFTTILDANHDGSALDDVARMGAGMLGNLFGRK